MIGNSKEGGFLGGIAGGASGDGGQGWEQSG